MPAWWRREQKVDGGEGRAVEHEDGDETPTGQIAASQLAGIIRAADGERAGRPGVGADPEQAAGTTAAGGRAEGTDAAADASVTDVNSAHVLTPDAPENLQQALADRHALIQLCLYALDRARSGGVVERLEEGLAAIGVRALRPAGQRFDPARHEAGGAVQTDDASLEGIVAETEVAGFVDHEKLLRAPIVTVYTRR